MRPGLFSGHADMRKLLLLLLLLTGIFAVAGVFLPAGLIRLAVMGFLAMPVMLIFFDRPAWILYFLLALIFSNLYLFTDLPAIRLTAVFMIVSFSVACVNGRRIVIHDRKFLVLVAAMLILAFQSMALARDIDSSINRIGQFFRHMVYIFFIVQFSRNRKEFVRILVVISLASFLNNFLPFVLSLPEKHADLSLMWSQGIFRYEGYNREANMFAFGLNFLIPILFFLVVKFRKPWFVRPLLIAFIGGNIFILFLSFSRGGFVGLVVMFLTLFFVERKNRVVLFTGLALMIIGGLLAPAVYWERLSSLLDIKSSLSADFAILSRIETMKVAIILGLKNPLFGIGIENFLFYASRFVPFGNVVHNSLLQIFSDMGLLALVVITWIIINNFRVIKRLMSRYDDPEMSQLGRVLFIQQVAVLANSMFIPVAFNLDFWLAMAFPTIAWYAYNESRACSRSTGGSVFRKYPADQN